jgi:YHS domain-containing protein
MRYIFFILALIILVPVIRGILGTFMRLLMSWAHSGAAANGSGPQRPPSGPPPASGPSTLRRDPVCGAYVSEDIAVTVRDGNATLFFCSAACRDKYNKPA